MLSVALPLGGLAALPKGLVATLTDRLSVQVVRQVQTRYPPITASPRPPDMANRSRLKTTTFTQVNKTWDDLGDQEGCLLRAVPARGAPYTGGVRTAASHH